MPQAPRTNIIGSPFIELQSVDSTNNYARQQVHAACLPDRQGLAHHGITFFAHEQTAGKGQRGRVWTSAPGANIAMSIIVNPAPLLLNQQFQLSACVAVAVHEFFMKYSGDETKIKWPNDLYWQDRKAGGILIESGVGPKGLLRRRQSERTPSEEAGGLGAAGGWNWSIVGIGININQTIFPDYLPNPVSLKQITGRDFNTIALAKELCSAFQRRFDELISFGFENIFNAYNRNLYRLNEKVRLKKGNRVFEALIKGISTDGKLLVQHSMEEEFGFREVEWVI